jgi:hypothetical protein
MRVTFVDDTKRILDGCTESAEQAFQKTSGSVAARDAALYLAHTQKGESLRRIAKATGKHPSTVMRAVRRVEDDRDDPLFDKVLTEAETSLETKGQFPANDNRPPPVVPAGSGPDLETVRREAKKYLRRLSEPEAFLLIARNAEVAGVFCASNRHSRPIAVFNVDLAAEFLRQDWIKQASRGAASVRYKITEVGRSFLRRTLAEEKSSQRQGMAEAATPFQNQHKEMGERLFADPTTGKPELQSVNLGESPLGWLARRKGPDGKPFLTMEEVEAGERLRSDFELAQLGPRVAQDWRKFLAPGDKYSGTPIPGGPGGGASSARDRVTAALAELGPGLADVALRTCCFLEGLEACERRMGWSARSAKVVLKLGLQRLAEHYGLKVFKD